MCGPYLCVSSFQCVNVPMHSICVGRICAVQLYIDRFLILIQYSTNHRNSSVERSQFLCKELVRDNNDAITEYWKKMKKKISLL